MSNAGETRAVGRCRVTFPARDARVAPGVHRIVEPSTDLAGDVCARASSAYAPMLLPCCFAQQRQQTALARQGRRQRQLQGSTRWPLRPASHAVPYAARSHHIAAVAHTPPEPPFLTCTFGTLTGSAEGSLLRGYHEAVPRSTVAMVSVPLLVCAWEQRLGRGLGHAWARL